MRKKKSKRKNLFDFVSMDKVCFRFALLLLFVCAFFVIECKDFSYNNNNDNNSNNNMLVAIVVYTSIISSLFFPSLSLSVCMLFLYLSLWYCFCKQASPLQNKKSTNLLWIFRYQREKIHSDANLMCTFLSTFWQMKKTHKFRKRIRWWERERESRHSVLGRRNGVLSAYMIKHKTKDESSHTSNTTTNNNSNIFNL